MAQQLSTAAFERTMWPSRLSLKMKELNPTVSCIRIRSGVPGLEAVGSLTSLTGQQLQYLRGRVESAPVYKVGLFLHAFLHWCLII